MNPNINLLLKNTNFPSLTTQVREASYALQDDIDPTFIPFLEQLIKESKSEDFRKIALETLNFYRETMSKEQTEKVNKLLEKIIIDKNYSFEIKKEAIIQRGYFGKWPDLALRSTIEKSAESELKIFAFRSILTELKLPHQVIDLERV